MNREVVDIFRAVDPRLLVDCTLGMGGHSHQLLQACPNCRILGIDMDAASLDRARTHLSDFAPRVSFLCANFVDFLDEGGIDPAEISGVLIDPGLSMMQLKEADRGFSHSLDGPLDMRKDRRQELTAAQVVNTAPQLELERIFREYGEVPRAREIAKKIIEKRLYGPLQTTGELRRLVEDVCRWRPRPGLLHPAAQVFQALRIHINRELDGLREFFLHLAAVLSAGARIVFIAYHSLEDRVAKTVFRELQQQGRLQLIRPFPMRPSDDEVRLNPPSRSARLRAVEVV